MNRELCIHGNLMYKEDKRGNLKHIKCPECEKEISNLEKLKKYIEEKRGYAKVGLNYVGTDMETETDPEELLKLSYEKRTLNILIQAYDEIMQEMSRLNKEWNINNLDKLKEITLSRIKALKAKNIEYNICYMNEDFKRNNIVLNCYEEFLAEINKLNKE